MVRHKAIMINGNGCVAALVGAIILANVSSAVAQLILPIPNVPGETPPGEVPAVPEFMEQGEVLTTEDGIGLLPPEPYVEPVENVMPESTEIVPVESDFVEPQLSSELIGSPSLSSLPWANSGTVTQASPLQRYGYSTPVRASFYGGDSYAEPDPFLSLDILRPLYNRQFQDGSEQLSYADVRVGLSTAGGGGLANIGLGQRVYMPSSDSIFDMNMWYDVDGTRDRVFHQIAAGGQYQNRNFLLRSHYYYPVGDTEETIGFTSLTGNTAFQGNNLALERFREEEQAFEGYDVEAGLILPGFGQTARWFVGYYNFEAKDADALVGYSSTINFDPIPNVTVGLQVTYDEETRDTGYLFSATYDFYQGPRDPAPNIRHRLGENVRRNHHIVSRRQRINDPELATDANGNLINFIHVSTAGNSNGTFESPYANLSQAAADAQATPGSIIIAHANSIFDGQSIVLPANTRFLGEGIQHSVVTADTQLGTIVLPVAGGGTALPIIRSSPATGPAITLASSTEVNGFRIESAGADAIFGAGQTAGTSILNTTVDGAGNGLHLFEASGPYTIQGLNVSNATGTGIWLEDSQAAAAITFGDAVSVDSTGLYGIHFDRNQDGSSATFDGVVNVANTTSHGIFFDDNGDNATATFNSAVAVSNTGGNGVVVSNLDTTTVTTGTDITFANSLTITNTTGSGLTTDVNDSNVSIATLAISNWNDSAIEINGGDAQFNVTNPVFLNNINGSLDPTLQITSFTGSAAFGDVTITDTARTALGAPTVFLSQNETGVDEITFNTLNVTSNNGTGLFAQDSGANVSKLVIRGGSINTTGSTAVFLDTLSTDITLQSVFASNTPIGVNLRNLGQANAFHDRFQIVGNSVTAGSGGVLTNVQYGVMVDGAEDVFLNLMNIDSSTAGVRAQANGFNQPENLVVNRMVLTDTGGTANWVGIDVDWDNGAHFGDANIFSNNLITGTGASQNGIRIDNNQSNPALEATIGGNTISMTGATSNGISLIATGVTPLQTTNVGDINLTATLDNIINVTAAPFITNPTNGASITGQILVNGVLTP